MQRPKAKVLTQKQSEESEKGGKEDVDELLYIKKFDLGFGDESNQESNHESIDPEAELDELESNASIDPEAELDELESDKNSVKSENIENTDILLDLPEEEFIIDDEDFVIQETKSDIKIFEEEVIRKKKLLQMKKTKMMIYLMKL